ncbi:MAG: hemerythrin domain-containing protein, partial [Candidatus Bathyarchaeota archaeon]
MLPIGPLMREHRLIERMVNLINDVEIKIKEENKIDSNFIEVVVDFFRTYADKCHHGKEEDILFEKLAVKNLKNSDRKIMEDLIEGHVFARKTVSKLEQENKKYNSGSKSAINKIKELLPFDLQKLGEIYDESLDVQKEILEVFLKLSKQE